MNQILSQNEVEALLLAVDGQGLEDPSALDLQNEPGAAPRHSILQTRSTAAADRRFEEVRPIIEDTFEQSARTFRGFLLGALARDISVERFSTELVGYQDFASRYDLFGRPYTFLPFDIQPKDKTGIIIFEPSLAIGLMEGYMGGALDQDPVPTWRTLTPLELKIAERMKRALLDAISSALKARAPLVLQPLKAITNAHLVRGLREMAAAVAVGLRVLIRSRSLGECYVLLPHEVIDFFRTDDANTFDTNQEEAQEWGEALMNGFMNVNMTLSAELGTVNMSVGDLLNLKVGDRISLNSRPGRCVIRVGGVSKFEGVPGVFRGHRALRVL